MRSRCDTHDRLICSVCLAAEHPGPPQRRYPVDTT